MLATDPEGNATAFTYDSLDRLTKTDQPAGISITYGYDASSRPTSYKDALGHETKYDYDALDRRTMTTYPDARTETYSYDKAGNLISWKDPANNRVTQAFDSAGRLLTRSVVPGTGVIGPLAETYTHDGLGWLTQAQSGNVVTQRSYDSLSRVVSETSGGKTLTYGFDDASNPSQIKYPSGYTLNQTVDPLDLLQTVSSPAIPNPLAAYRWQGTGSPVKKDFANGLSEADAFDPSGRLISKKVTQARGVVLVVWDGWRPVEEYKNDQLISHRTYGADLDEIVQLENHFDANGENPTSYIPVFDQTGNLAVATGATASPSRPMPIRPTALTRSRSTARQLMSIRLGSRAGVATDRVRATATGVAGEALFYASATPGPAAALNLPFGGDVTPSPWPPTGSRYDL